jgi:hypothetical protein
VASIVQLFIVQLFLVHLFLVQLFIVQLPGVSSAAVPPQSGVI